MLIHHTLDRIMDDNPQTRSLLNIFFWTTVLVYIHYKFIKNIGFVVLLLDSLWHNAFRLGHFCIRIFNYDT